MDVVRYIGKTIQLHIRLVMIRIKGSGHRRRNSGIFLDGHIVQKFSRQRVSDDVCRLIPTTLSPDKLTVF